MYYLVHGRDVRVTGVVVVNWVVQDVDSPLNIEPNDPSDSNNTNSSNSPNNPSFY